MVSLVPSMVCPAGDIGSPHEGLLAWARYPETVTVLLAPETRLTVQQSCKQDTEFVLTAACQLPAWEGCLLNTSSGCLPDSCTLRVQAKISQDMQSPHMSTLNNGGGSTAQASLSCPQPLIVCTECACLDCESAPPVQVRCAPKHLEPVVSAATWHLVATAAHHPHERQQSFYKDARAANVPKPCH